MTLLQDHEPPAVTVARESAGSPFFLTCDHASNRVPAALGTLGLAAGELDRHIAWDIGALAVARGLSAALDATLVASGYSRLVMDMNRPLERTDSIPVQSETTAIKVNEALPAAERTARREALFEPYHGRIRDLLDQRQRRGQPTLLIAIHSFTPVYRGEARPWQVALLSNRDRRVAEFLLEHLRREPGLEVGDNIPYRLTDEGDYGVPVHGEQRGLPHVLIELRQDEIAATGGQTKWVRRLAPLLTAAWATLQSGNQE